jgi:hypothetical protein
MPADSGKLPIGKRATILSGLVSPTGSLQLKSPEGASIGKAKRWADYTPAAGVTPAGPLPPTPGSCFPRTPAGNFFGATPTPYDDTYQPGFGFGIPMNSSTAPSSSTIAAPVMSSGLAPPVLPSGTFQNFQSGMYMTPSTTAQPMMMPYQTTMAQAPQSEGMQMMWVPMQNGMLQSGMTQPAMMASPAPMMATVINSSTSTSPSQVTTAVQDLPPGTLNQPAPQMMVIGMMPAQAMPPQQAQPPQEGRKEKGGLQLMREALDPDTFDMHENTVAPQGFVNEQGAASDLPLPSPGSALHGTGNCQPCAWFWKAKGCMNDKSCAYCHLCPEGELKQRKKAKVTAMRMGALEPSTTSGPPAIKLTQLLGDS